MSTYILGIHDGHNCGASLLKDGEIIGSIQEERISRRKNEVGYPKESINTLLKDAGIAGKDLSYVSLASNFMHTASHLEQITPWYRVGKDDQEKDKLRNKDYNKILFDQRQKERLETIQEHLGIKQDQIEFCEHHLGHAAAAYFTAPYEMNEEVLVITADGAGDGVCATVHIGKDGKLERLLEVDRHKSLGKLYSRVTYLMGMKPWEHEYKVMGMAPYAGGYQMDKAKKVFESILGLTDDGTDFVLKNDLSTHYSYFYLREQLENIRFDSIAGAIQEFTEEFLERWVTSWIKKTGIKKIALGGGVFMNVKANLRVAKTEWVDDMYVCPSCGDESLSMGGAALMHFQKTGDKQKHPLKNLYLGSGYTNDDVKKAIEKFDLSDYEVTFHDDINDHVGKELANNEVVARVNGRMEWGARALGNRSILANASHADNIRLINAMIKQRDFWMPFSPSMIAERTPDYMENPKKIPSPFMMYAFDGKERARKDLPAAMHPYDGTLRAQTVTEELNPGYYAVLKSYEKETGKGGVLNTSFNLHGFPIVNTPEDAIDVLLRSGLRNLAVENYYISLKK